MFCIDLCRLSHKRASIHPVPPMCSAAPALSYLTIPSLQVNLGMSCCHQCERGKYSDIRGRATHCDDAEPGCEASCASWGMMGMCMLGLRLMGDDGDVHARAVTDGDVHARAGADG